MSGFYPDIFFEMKFRKDKNEKKKIFPCELRFILSHFVVEF